MIHFAPHVLAIFVLLLLAAISAIFLKRLKFPYTIGLVIIGIILAGIIDDFTAFEQFTDIQLSHDVIMYLILPTLIFDAAVNIDSRLLIKNLVPIVALAAPGLIISTLIIGIFMQQFTPLHLGVAMLFGALISATDPVAVIALFKDIGAPKRLTILVDGESLFNDATAIVAFNIILALILSGTALSFDTATSAVLDFFYVFIGGLIFGLLVGYIITLLIKMASDEPLIQIALSTVLAYASFIVADHYLGISGVMSTLGAGIIVSWYGASQFTEKSKEALKGFWEFATFVANSFIFLLLGVAEWEMLIKKGHTPNIIMYLIYTIVIVTIARFIVVFGITPLLKFLPKYEKISVANRTVIFWGGLRGAVPLALVLSLKSNFESHQLLVEFTLGIVLFTLLVQGTTTKMLMKLFKLNKISLFDRITAFQTKLDILNKTKNFLLKMKDDGYISGKIFNQMNEDNDKSSEMTLNEIKKHQNNPAFNQDTVRKIIWNQAFLIEFKTYQNLYESGLITESVFRELEFNIDLEREKIKKNTFPLLNIEGTPLETKLKIGFVDIFKFIVPASKYTKILKNRVLISRIETSLAMIAANDQINSNISNIPNIYSKQLEVINECKHFYLMRSKQAVKQVRTLEKNKSIQALQSKKLSKTVFMTQIKAIDELAYLGSISETVADLLKSDIKLKN